MTLSPTRRPTSTSSTSRYARVEAHRSPLMELPSQHRCLKLPWQTTKCFVLIQEEPLRVYHLLGCQLESHVHNSFLLITPEHVRVTLEAPDEPQHAAWMGAFEHVPGMFR